MKILKKIWNIVTTALVVFMVLCAVFLMGSRLLGYECYNVISGSMKPTYYEGDLIYVKKADVNTIKEGDVITFVLNDKLVVATHRVVRVDSENKHFYTKGDYNNIEDSEPVHFNNVIGVPEFSIPLLGYVAEFIQTSPGMYITIGVGVILVLIVFLPDLLKAKKKDEKTEETAEPNSASEENERLKKELLKLKEELKNKE